jgi:hypothetical protein
MAGGSGRATTSVTSDAVVIGMLAIRKVQPHRGSAGAGLGASVSPRGHSRSGLLRLLRPPRCVKRGADRAGRLLPRLTLVVGALAVVVGQGKLGRLASRGEGGTLPPRPLPPQADVARLAAGIARCFAPVEPLARSGLELDGTASGTVGIRRPPHRSGGGRGSG